MQMCEQALFFYTDRTAAAKNIDQLLASLTPQVDNHACSDQLLSAIVNMYQPHNLSDQSPMTRFCAMDAIESSFPMMEKHKMASMGVSVGSLEALDMRVYAASEAARTKPVARNRQASILKESAVGVSTFETAGKRSHAEINTPRAQAQAQQAQELDLSQLTIHSSDDHLEVDDAVRGDPMRPSYRSSRTVDSRRARVPQALRRRLRDDKSAYQASEA